LLSLRLLLGCSYASPAEQGMALMRLHRQSLRIQGSCAFPGCGWPGHPWLPTPRSLDQQSVIQMDDLRKALGVEMTPRQDDPAN
jgi:hypothetical protein